MRRGRRRRRRWYRDAIRWHRESRERPNDARLVVPDQASLTERHSANAAAAALEIVEHRYWFVVHLLAEAFGDDRHVDESEKVVRVRPQSATVEGGENARFAA